MVIPNRVVSEVLQYVAIFILYDVYGEAAPAVVRRVEPGHWPARDPQSSANWIQNNINYERYNSYQSIALQFRITKSPTRPISKSHGISIKLLLLTKHNL